MQIGNALPSYFYISQAVMPARQPVLTEPAGSGRPDGFNSPAASVEISPQALAASAECETCSSRRYVDQSDDPSVSFQAPTHVSPGQSAAAVMAHEREHVVNEQARADRDGSRVISQTVSIQMSTCPECKRVYASGGTTRTVTAKDGGSDQMADMPTPGIDLTI